MSTYRMIPVNPGADLRNIVDITCRQLNAQGYGVAPQMLSPVNAVIIITKDRDGFKNVMGMGLECKVTLAMMNNCQLSVNIESEWTNKIIALAVGWIFCWVPFVTGIIGCVNQSGLNDQIISAVTSATAGGQGGYQQPYNQQPPYNNYNH